MDRSKPVDIHPWNEIKSEDLGEKFPQSGVVIRAPHATESEEGLVDQQPETAPGSESTQ